jgi:hypothetical protein
MSGGKNWSGSNWTQSNWDASNWLGPNDGTPGGPTYADASAVITSSGAVVASLRATARASSVILAGAQIASAGAVADGGVVPPVVKPQTPFGAPTWARNEQVQAERQRAIKRTASDMNDVIAVLSAIAASEIEEEEWVL